MAGRRWFEAFLLVMCIGSGLLGLTGNASDRAIELNFPSWGQYLWYGGLVLGGATALLGVLVVTYTGVGIERAGLLLLSGLCAGYTAGAVILCVVNDSISAYLTVLVFAFALLCHNRAREARRERSNYRAELHRLAALRGDQP